MEGRLLTRRQLLAATLIVSAASQTTGCSSVRKQQALKIRGADISFTLQEEAAGRTFSAAGRTAPVERILADRGANYVRLRIWVNPEPGTSDETAALTLARRAKDAGLKVLLCLHYSDSWADHENQNTPAAWQDQDLSTMAATVHNYTHRVVGAFASQGTPVDMVQIGNEVTNGMLWPLGRISETDTQSWTTFATLVNAAIAGAGDGNPSDHELAVMLHIHPGADEPACQYFFDSIRKVGVTEFNVIGLSYYPFWQGSLGELSANLHFLASRYSKNLIVVETSYPWTLAQADTTVNVMNDPTQLPQAQKYPPTEQGQLAYFVGLRNVLQAVPDGLGSGFFDWAPEWLPPVRASAQMGNAFSNLTMFDLQGQALPALDVAFREPIT
jgi:arabinogalactan endo-1,4-beta-galactosidase